MKKIIQKILEKIQFKGVHKLSKKTPKILHAKHTVHRKPPLNYTGNGFEHEFEQEIWEMRLHELENVKVHVKNGIVFKRWSVLLDSFLYPGHKKHNFNFYQYLFLKLKGKTLQLDTQETYLVAHNIWGQGLFHWVLDALPRIYAVKDLTPQLTLLLPKSYEANDIAKGWTPFHKESLAPFGFKNIIEIEDNTCAKVPKLILPSHVAITGNYNVAIMAGLRQLYHAYFVHNTSEKVLNLGEKIYITRTKALWRKVKNDTAVMELMKSLGFTIVNFEDYTFSEKVQIAYHARYFVGIFSSGQSIATFMQPNSYLLDFRLDDNHNLAIYSLCEAMQIHYLYQVSEVADSNTTDTVFNPQKWNMIVDVGKLKENLTLMLNAPIY